MSDGITEKLSRIQSELVAPKNQFNKFGNYNYRSCEDIVEAAKPLLLKEGLVLLLSDEIVEVGGRVYVKATAKVASTNTNLSVTAFAREPAEQKGMACPQITGSASSYARKYALNGLFAIDDTKDADSTNKHGKEEKKQEKKEEKKELTFLESIDAAKKVVGETFVSDCLTSYKYNSAKGVKKEDEQAILKDLRKQATKVQKSQSMQNE